MRLFSRRRSAYALALCLAALALLNPGDIGRQDLSSLLVSGPAGTLAAVALPVGMRVALGASEATPILARGVRRLEGHAIVRTDEGGIVASLPRGDTPDPAGLRVNRAARADSLAERKPPTEAQEAVAAWFSLAFSYSDLALPSDGFSRALPPIHERIVLVSRPPPPPPLEGEVAQAAEAAVAEVAGAPEPLERPETREEAFDRLARLSIRSNDELERAHHCLSEAIYFESRSESERGQQAVAQVVLNRVQSGRYPNTVCDVIYQNRHRRNACQFSYACDRHPERIRDERAWEIASRIADDAIAGRVFLDEIGDSTHYHANYVAPRWRRSLYRTERIGTHIFYRMPGVSINGS